ncbi:MAG: transcriptional repressor [Actinobacteria bacterium]|nr:transcriptional repressor [Actinomycetota bacterium]
MEAKEKDIKNLVQEKGLRMTRQRKLILDEFVKQSGHITTYELYHRVKEKDAGIGYSTVFRLLRILVSSGFAKERNFSKKVSAYEPIISKGHHDHLICQVCGRVVEFENVEIEKLQSRITDEHDFSITSHKLEIYGVCKECK